MARGRDTKVEGVYAKPNGTFTVRAVVYGMGQRLEKQVVFTGTLNQAKARKTELETELRNRIDNEIVKGSSTDLIRSAAVYWMKQRLDTERGRVSTRTRYQEHLDRYIVPYFGEMRIGAVKPKTILDWQTWLGDQKTKRGKPYAKATLKGAWRTLRIFLKDVCVNAGVHNPTDQLGFHVKGLPPRKRTWLTTEEHERFLKATQEETPKWRALLTLMATTGMRFGEATALQWSDIRWETRQIAVIKGHAYGEMQETPKTGESGARGNPLVPEAHDALRAWQAVWPHHENDLIFSAADDGDLLSNSCTRLALNRVCERAHIKRHVSNHDLRRTWGDFVRQEAGQTVAMALMGHVTPEMHRHYSSVDATEQMAAAEAVMRRGRDRGTLRGIEPNLGQAYERAG